MFFQQKLSSGVVIRQDFQKAVRFVMFETGVEGYEYATHGGTMFIVNFHGRPFGLTCAHVKGDFEWRHLVVADTKRGRNVAGLSAVYRPSRPASDAIGSDILDLAVVEFSPDIDLAFFNESTYILEIGTISTASLGDSLLVYGALKAESSILETIAPVFALLEFRDNGPYLYDPVLRRAVAKYKNRDFDGLGGISGSPVFNKTNGTLSGMTIRGSIMDDIANVLYIDISHIRILLENISKGYSQSYYISIVFT